MEVDTKMESSKKCLSLSKTGSETSKCVSEVSESDFKEDVQRPKRGVKKAEAEVKKEVEKDLKKPKVESC